MVNRQLKTAQIILCILNKRGGTEKKFVVLGVRGCEFLRSPIAREIGNIWNGALNGYRGGGGTNTPF